jgi:hypothetical protein
MGILSMLVKIGVDAVKFETDLKRLQSLGEKFGSSFKSAITSKLGQALSAGAVIGFTKHLMTAADEITDLAEQLNITTDEVQRLQILAGETGVSFDKLTSVLNKFEQARLKATSGDEEAIKTLQALGLSTEELNNLELSVRVSQAYKDSGRSASTTTALTDLYGLKLKTAGAALAEYQSTAGRDLISKENLDTIAKGNNLFEEQVRHLKALASKPLADGITALADAIKYLSDENSNLNKAFGAKVTPAQIGRTYFGNVPGAAEAFRIASGNAPIPKAESTVNPPPIGSPEFERVKGAKFSLGGGQDSLARIGGFTGFQSAQDTAIKQAIEQTLQLRQIVKNTGKTAENTRD